MDFNVVDHVLKRENKRRLQAMSVVTWTNQDPISHTLPWYQVAAGVAAVSPPPQNQLSAKKGALQLGMGVRPPRLGI